MLIDFQHSIDGSRSELVAELNYNLRLVHEVRHNELPALQSMHITITIKIQAQEEQTALELIPGALKVIDDVKSQSIE